MQVFRADEWRVGKETVTLPLGDVHEVEIAVSCSKDVQLLGLRQGQAVPLKIGREFRTRAKTEGFTALQLKGTGKTEFGFRFRSIVRQDGEPLDHENPPAVPMPSGNNMLLQIRKIMRDEFMRQRLHLLEPEDLPFANRYQVDDDEDVFEEEIFARENAPPQDPGDTPPEAVEGASDAPEQPEGLARAAE